MKPPTHTVKVTPDQHRRLLDLQEIWQRQRLVIIAGTHLMTAADYIAEAKAICPDMREGHENIFEIVEPT